MTAQSTQVLHFYLCYSDSYTHVQHESKRLIGCFVKNPKISNQSVEVFSSVKDPTRVIEVT